MTRVESLVKRAPVVVSPSTTIRQAAEVFAREKIGLLVVSSTTNPVKPEAVLSERDIVRAVASGISLNERIDAISTKRLITVKRTEPLYKAAKLMVDNNIRHLLVENDDGTLFGVLSIRDFFKEQRLLQSLLEEEKKEYLATD